MPPVILALSLAAALSAPAQTPTSEREPLPAIETSHLPGDAGKAVSSAYAAARATPEDPAVVGRLALVLHAWEQWDAAAATYRVVQALAPKEPHWWHLAGLLEAARGRHGDALRLFERAAALDRSSAATRLRLAEARLETGDIEASQQLLVDLVRHPATAAPAEYALGRIAMMRGEPERSLEHLDRAVELFPDFGAAHYARALAHRRLGRSKDAEQALLQQQRCIPCWPAVEDRAAALVTAARNDGRAALNRGLELAKNGRVQEAIEAHEQAVAASPTLLQARVNLITLYGRVSRWGDAEAQYRHVTSGSSGAGEAHAVYAQVLLLQRRATDAVGVFEQALAANSADARSRNGLGLALEMLGNRGAAMEAYRQASSDAPALRVARFNYGRILVTEGRVKEAIVEFEKLQAPEDAETPQYLFALAAARVRAGDVTRGREEAVTAMRLATRYGQSKLAASIERDLATLK